MAEKDDLNLGNNQESSESKGKGGKKKTLIIAVVALLLIGGGLGGYLLMGKDDANAAVEPGAESTTVVEEEIEEERDPIYLSLNPTFVVNFEHKGNIRYLQLSLQVMSYDQAVIDKVDLNMPAVRNSLIMLFSAQDFDLLNTVAGKEQLRSDVLDAVKKVVRLKADQKLDDAFFTDFVMQ